MSFENATENFNEFDLDCPENDCSYREADDEDGDAEASRAGRRDRFAREYRSAEEQFPHAVTDWLEHENAEPLYCIIRTLTDRATAKMCAGNRMLSDPSTRDSIRCTAAFKALMRSGKQFFLRDGRTEPNTDFTAFKSWVYTITQNTRLDEERSIIRRSSRLTDMEDEGLMALPDPHSGNSYAERETSRALLAHVIDLALNGKYECHSRLVWLLYITLTDAYGWERVKVENCIVNTYGDRPLSAIAACILRRLDNSSAVRLTTVQKQRLLKTLEGHSRAAGDADITCGEMPLSAFYMKKGALYSVSDWIEKVNSSVTGKVAAEQPCRAVS